MSFITISLCLSDIPRDRIKQVGNGKKYINLMLSERKEIGKYGETHTLVVSKTKEERGLNEPTIYVGSGKKYEQQSVATTPESVDDFPKANEVDDLPF